MKKACLMSLLFFLLSVAVTWHAPEIFAFFSQTVALPAENIGVLDSHFLFYVFIDGAGSDYAGQFDGQEYILDLGTIDADASHGWVNNVTLGTVYNKTPTELEIYVTFLSTPFTAIRLAQNASSLTVAESEPLNIDYRINRNQVVRNQRLQGEMVLSVNEPYDPDNPPLHLILRYYVEFE